MIQHKQRPLNQLDAQCTVSHMPIFFLFLCLNRHQKYVSQSNDNNVEHIKIYDRKIIVSTMHKLSNNSHNSCVHIRQYL